MPRALRRADCAARLSDLPTMQRAALLGLWQEIFGLPSPKGLSVGFLRKVLTFELQCRLEGGLRPSTLRRLRALAGNGTSGESASPQMALSPGTRLMREWNGRSYQVEVKADGFVLDGRSYASLSAVARRITGARWSGPQFFGLKPRAAETVPGDA